ncbi:MAG: polysaccharide biosynthesis tyrosine autokinase [Anaerolineae bacterium]|nr:polysaccharide biosynthesis tyrosine autokinase [Anaerolineae bacterium]
MELRQYLLLARRWWWLVILLAVLGGGVSFGISLFKDPIYEASTNVLIYQAPGSLPDEQAVLAGQRVAATYAELLHQRPVLEKVIADLGLATSPDLLERQITATPIRDTNLLVLSVRDTDPQRAADIANKIVAVFVEQNQEDQANRYADQLAILSEEIQRSQADIDNTEARLEALREETSLEGTAERNRLEELLTEKRGNHATLLQGYTEMRLKTTDKITVSETAQWGKKLTSPTRDTMMGIVIGIMAGVGIIILIEYLRETVKSDVEIKHITGAPTLGIIGNIRANGHGVLVTALEPRSVIAEAYRVLRANLEFAEAGERVSTLVVTSSGPVEGKSTTAANLAIALAQSGKRVILVDTDLRRPSLHKMFNQSNDRGLTSALLQMDDVSVNDCLNATEIDGLYLLPSGPLPPNPADLLGSQRMADLIENLRAQADIIIFDCPPLLAVADTTLLSRYCDAALLVVLSEATHGRALHRAKEQIDQSGIRLLGVVLNRVSPAASGYYQSYYHYPQEK